MNYLAIDCSGTHLTVLICRGNKTYNYFEKDCGVKHSVSLMKKVEELSLESGLDLSKVDFFAVVVGAGSFTGIRIGVATVKALCLAYNKPCLPITSFDTIAYNKRSGDILAVIDAGHNGYYVAGYKDNKLTMPPSYLSGEQLNEIKENKRLLSFDKISAFDTEIVDLVKGLKASINIKKNKLQSAENLMPLYIRKSQAEEGR